jgi:hypothetical protein
MFPWKYFFSIKWERSKEIKKRVAYVRGGSVLVRSPEVREHPQANTLRCPSLRSTHLQKNLPYNFRTPWELLEPSAMGRRTLNPSIHGGALVGAHSLLPWTCTWKTDRKGFKSCERRLSLRLSLNRLKFFQSPCLAYSFKSLKMKHRWQRSKKVIGHTHTVVIDDGPFYHSQTQWQNQEALPHMSFTFLILFWHRQSSLRSICV